MLGYTLALSRAVHRHVVPISILSQNVLGLDTMRLGFNWRCPPVALELLAALAARIRGRSCGSDQPMPMPHQRPSQSAPQRFGRSFGIGQINDIAWQHAAHDTERLVYCHWTMTCILDDMGRHAQLWQGGSMHPEASTCCAITESRPLHIAPQA